MKVVINRKLIEDKEHQESVNTNIAGIVLRLADEQIKLSTIENELGLDGIYESSKLTTIEDIVSLIVYNSAQCDLRLSQIEDEMKNIRSRLDVLEGI